MLGLPYRTLALSDLLCSLFNELLKVILMPFKIQVIPDSGFNQFRIKRLGYIVNSAKPQGSGVPGVPKRVT